jgi:hypothetical protein
MNGLGWNTDWVPWRMTRIEGMGAEGRRLFSKADEKKWINRP